jgi:two-component system response regulator YesN
MISRFEPDIVITDIQMPRMDGLKMIEQAKALGAPCIYVILSGYSEFEYARKGLQLGVTDYLLKPVTISVVKELLAKFADSDEPEQETGQGQVYSHIVQGMLDAVEKNCGMSLSLESFAETYHMTPEYISNLFAREVGTSFSNYKKQARLEKAKLLLLTTEMKVYEVACAVGYPDQKYFSRVFKEYTGVSAKQFTLHYYMDGNEVKQRE